MKKDILSKLFGSTARVKVLRLFLSNPSYIFEKEEVLKRTRVEQALLNKEIKLLKDTNVIKEKTFTKEIIKKLKKGDKIIKKKVTGFILDETFEYNKPLSTLLLDTDSYSGKELKKRFDKTGKIKLIIASGVFLRDEDARLDILLVGDKLNLSAVESVVKIIESEIGRELSYATFVTSDFLYRYEMRDKLIYDVLDYDHDVVFQVNPISLNTKRK
ncbi:MAG: hypothetical protein ACI9AR_000029 [Flavobacteriaceae bacterium]|jgi:hypothetical protein